MIIKNFELEKINSSNLNIHLIYGNNEGIKQDIISNFYTKNYKGEVLKYDEAEILNNKDEFISSLLNKSLFETEKLIIISRGTDKLTTVIDEVLDRQEIGAKIIIKSSNLEKKSKLRNLFEKEKKVICTPVYEDDSRSLNFIINNFLKDYKLSLSQEIKNILIERSNGDRINLKNELSKLKNLSITKKKLRSVNPPRDPHPWITKYIFPGGYTPSLSEVTTPIEKAGLIVADIEVLRLHYSHTLRHWKENCIRNKDKIIQMFDERFFRMWEFYLAGCEMAFKWGDQVVYQFQLTKSYSSTPVTRDYIYQ